MGPILADLPEFLGEFVCRVTSAGTMTVVAEARGGDGSLVERMGTLLKNGLGIEVDVELAAAGETGAAHAGGAPPEAHPPNRRTGAGRSAFVNPARPAKIR